MINQLNDFDYLGWLLRLLEIVYWVIIYFIYPFLA